MEEKKAEKHVRGRKEGWGNKTVSVQWKEGAVCCGVEWETARRREMLQLWPRKVDLRIVHWRDEHSSLWGEPAAQHEALQRLHWYLFHNSPNTSLFTVSLNIWVQKHVVMLQIFTKWMKVASVRLVGLLGCENLVLLLQICGNTWSMRLETAATYGVIA